MNSRNKGKRGERQWRDELRAKGYHARRGQQFAGSPDSPDVVCDELDWIHFEVKAVERLNIEDAMEQARRDCGAGRPGQQKTPVVAHRRSHRRWLVTMEAEFFFELLREFQPRMDTDKHGCTSPQPTPGFGSAGRPSPQSGAGGGAQGTARPAGNKIWDAQVRVAPPNRPNTENNNQNETQKEQNV